VPQKSREDSAALARFSEEDRAELVDRLHHCGIEFTRMAQSVDG
jgi:hypothetical protein